MGHVLQPADTDILLNHHSETRNAIKLFATRGEVKRVNDEMFARLRSNNLAGRSIAGNHAADLLTAPLV